MNSADIIKEMRVLPEIDAEFEGEEGIPRALTKLGTLYLHIEGKVDAEEEQARLQRQLDKVKGELVKLSRKLENIKFIEKAPEDVVEAERERRSELVAESDKLQKRLTTLRQR